MICVDSSNNSISLSQDIIKLIINFLIKSGCVARPLIISNQWINYIFYLFVFSNIVKCNLCKFSAANIARCKSTTCYWFHWCMVFLFKTKPYISIFYLQPTIKLTNTICLVQHPLKVLVWFGCWVLFMYVFILAFYLWFMSCKTNIIV